MHRRILLASIALARKSYLHIPPVAVSAVLSCALLHGNVAHAQSAGLALNIPAGSLQSVLTQFAARTGVSLDFRPELVSGKTSAGVQGTYSVIDALHRLLAGTGVDVVSESERIYSLVPAASAATPPKAPPATPSAETSPSDAVLPSITVTGQVVTDQGYHDEGFSAPTTRSATHTDTPVALIPQSVQVVTQAVSESQQAQTPLDALSNVSGVTIDSNAGSPQVYIRGFSAPVMQDGVTALTGTSGIQTPMAGLERVEVIKGANAILSGEMQPGGSVNLVRKKPQADPTAEVSAQVGSYGDYLTSFDLGGALTPDKSLTYRLIGSGEYAGQTTYDYAGSRNLYFAPSLGFQRGGTSIIVGLEQNVIRTPVGPYTVIGPQGPLALNGPIGNPDDRVVLNTTTLYFNLDQKLNQNWTFHSDETYSRSQVASNTYQLATSIGLPGTVPALPAPIGIFLPLATGVDEYAWTTNQRLSGKFTIGPVSQTVMAGFQYQQNWSNETVGTGSPIFAPLGNGASFPPANPEMQPVAGSAKEYFDNFYIQDQLSFNRLHVLGSIGRGTAWTGSEASQAAWTPSIGVLYQLTADLGVYANDTSTFTPQPSDLLVGGGVAPPQRGHSIEAGTKLSLLNDRLSITAALFRSALSNVALPDPTNPLFFIVGSAAVSRGFELDVTGRIMPGLNVIGNYTFSNFKQAEGTNDGLSQLAKHQGSVWITYDLPGEKLQGWGVGAGVNARSGYLATDTTGASFTVPGQARTDVSVYYQQKRWSATLGVKNVFNRRLYSDYASDLSLDEDPGRIILLSGKYDF